MSIVDIKLSVDNWDELNQDERIQTLLELHCYCKDIRNVSTSEEIGEYEVTLPNVSVNLFFESLLDIASNFNIEIQEHERVKISLYYNEMNLEACTNKKSFQC